jgi:hypothetical protein
MSLLRVTAARTVDLEVAIRTANFPRSLTSRKRGSRNVGAGWFNLRKDGDFLAIRLGKTKLDAKSGLGMPSQPDKPQPGSAQSRFTSGR